MHLTDLNYEKTISRYKSEFAALVDNIWEELETDPFYADEKKRVLSWGKAFGTEEKADIISFSDKAIQHPEFAMYRDLVKTGSFWHVLDRETELETLLGEEKMLEIEKLVIETASRSEQFIKLGYAAPGCKHPYFTLFHMYEEGKLERVMDSQMLKKITTNAFWEMAYYEQPLSQNYRTLLISFSKYFDDYLDLTSIKDGSAYKGPLHIEDWVTQHYINAFKRAEPALSREDVSKLVAPIIHHMLEKDAMCEAAPWLYYNTQDEYLDEYNSVVEVDSIEAVKRLYGAYRTSPHVQEALKNVTAKLLKLSTDSDVEVPISKNIPRIIRELIDWRTRDEMLGFVSENLPSINNSSDAELLFRAHKFPLSLIPKDRKEEIMGMLRNGKSKKIEKRSLRDS